MAKVQRPLQSGTASGQVGKATVHFDWKGVHAVRSYVVPANPRTIAQISVRTKFTNCLEDWHSPLMLPVDKEAWKRWAEVLRKPMTSLNAYTSERMKVTTKDLTWHNVWSYTEVQKTPGGLDFDVKGTKPNPLRCEVGPTLSYRPYVFNGTWDTVTSACHFHVTGLAENVPIYIRVIPAETGYWGFSGIYKSRTGKTGG